MKTSVDLDSESAAELEQTVAIVREKPATVLRMAIRAGLPLVAARFQDPRPPGYFAHDYKQNGRRGFEKRMSRASKQTIER